MRCIWSSLRMWSVFFTDCKGWFGGNRGHSLHKNISEKNIYIFIIESVNMYIFSSQNVVTYWVGMGFLHVIYMQFIILWSVVIVKPSDCFWFLKTLNALNCQGYWCTWYPLRKGILIKYQYIMIKWSLYSNVLYQYLPNFSKWNLQKHTLIVFVEKKIMSFKLSKSTLVQNMAFYDQYH